MQSSTWSSYKHHNTFKFLIACTPNGAICFVSPLFFGSISDVELTQISGFIQQLEGRNGISIIELTQISGFIQQLEGRNGISIMADRGSTVKDQLAKIGVDLNIPPFLEGRCQLPTDEVKDG